MQGMRTFLRSGRVEEGVAHARTEDEGRRRAEGGSVAWRVLFGVAVLLGLAWLVANRAEGQELIALVRDAQPRWLLVAIVLQAATYPVDGMVWKRALVRRGEHRDLGLGTITRLAFAKFFVDQFLPGGGVGGTVLTMRSLQTRGVSRDAAMHGLVARLVSYYFAYALALALAAAIAWVAADRLPRTILGLSSAAAVVFLFVPALLLWALRHPQRRLTRFLLHTRLLARARPLVLSMTRAAPAVGRDRGLLLECTAWQFAIFALDGATLWATLHAVGMATSLPVAYAGFLLGFLAGSVGIPAGIGVFEAGAVAGLALLGVPSAPALAATLLFRGFSLWLPLAPGAYYARRESWR